MISIRLQIISFIGLMLYFVGILILLRNKTISLRYTLMWIFSGVIMTILVIFPEILEIIAKILGIKLASNAVFAMVLFFVLLILLSLTGIVSSLNEKNKRLTQTIAIMGKRIRELEEKQISTYQEEKVG